MLWTDKKLLTVQAIHNHQNNRIFAVNKEDIPLNEQIVYKRLRPASVLVCTDGTSSGEKTPLIFIEEGVQINQHVYLNMLKEQLVPWINATFKESGITLQQDGATSHTANLVQELRNNNMGSFWTKELWPPSLDLSLMNFAVWSILERNACSPKCYIIKGYIEALLGHNFTQNHPCLT